MQAVIVYESMYGNTHLVAEAIASGLAAGNAVTVVPVAQAGSEQLADADLVVIGGPTHLHGMSQARTRAAATAAARKQGSQLSLDADAEGPGLRDWFASLGQVSAKAAAFDTRLSGPAAFTGRAAKGIGRLLRSHGFAVIAAPESFLVSSGNRLQPGEDDRARAWGERLGRLMAGAGAAAVGPD
jgi:hypothetical protein